LSGPADQIDVDDFWVFAYGSLMWRPGFPFAERRTARVHGYHRALRVVSWRHRGTAERPGLVLGLDRGGACLGRAYRVEAAEVDAVVAYLDEREMDNDVYLAMGLQARLDDGRRIKAYGFIVNRDHFQYAGDIGLDETVALVLQGQGESGACLDYVRSTVTHLDELGIGDGPLHQILAAAEAATAR
jgi:glutathione-specific gamma-glutamylcyclotransferase